MSEIEHSAEQTAPEEGAPSQAPNQDQATTDAEAQAQAEAAEAERVRRMFLRTDAAGAESFLFARWKQPVALSVIGLEPSSADRVKAGYATAAAEAGLELAETTPESGPTLLVVYCSDWSELKSAPGLERLIPDLDRRIAALERTEADSHRLFALSPQEGVVMGVSLVRYDADDQEIPIEALALGQAAQMLLAWSDEAFERENPISIRRGGRAAIRRWCGGLLKAAYVEGTPAYSTDPALADALAETMRRLAEEQAAARAEAKEREKAAREAKKAEAAAKAEAEAAKAAEASAEEASAEESAPTEAATDAEAPAEAPSETSADEPAPAAEGDEQATDRTA